MSIKKVYFVRHGETVGNVGKHFQFSDTPLSEVGHKGAQAVAERFRHIQVDDLIASPFIRAQQTAQYISEIIQKPVTTFEACHECLQALHIRGKKFESPEGQDYLQNYREKFSDPLWKPDGAENFFDIIQRVTVTVQMLENHEKENIVIVSHGAFIKSIVAYLLLDKNHNVKSNVAVAFNLKTMSNVGITEFTFEEGKWRLFTWNDHAHFAE